MLATSLLLGSRGLGALLGPLAASRWAGNSEQRLKLGILLGYLVVAAGYAAFARTSSLWLACLWAGLAHCGGSTVWAFSTTVLQIHSDDRFRGRVFAADLAFCMLTIAVGAYLCGQLVDHGVSPHAVAMGTGVVMLIPAALWAWAVRLWQPAPVLAVKA